MKIKNLILIFLCSLMAFSSCKTTEYISQTEYVHDTTYVSKNIHDSIYIDKNVYVRGDTVYRDTYKYVYRNLVDTLYRDNVVFKDKLVDKIVEKKVIPRWVWPVVGISILIILAGIAILAFKIYNKFH